MTTRDVTSDAANPDKTTAAAADKVMIIDSETVPPSLKEITLPNLMKLIAVVTAENDLQAADSILFYDASAGAARRLSPADFFAVIEHLTEQTDPASGDMIVIMDANAGTGRSVNVSNLYKALALGPAAGKFLEGDGSYSAVLDSDLSTSDIATNNMTTSKHGFQAKGSGSTSTFYRSDATQAVTPYVLIGSCAPSTPLDATTYYLGCFHGGVLTTTAGRRRVYIPRAGTVTRIDLFMNFANGSNETSTISFRLNDTTDTTISSAVACNAAPFIANTTGLSIAVAAGDYFEIKWVTPTWATEPTVVNISASVYIS